MALCDRTGVSEQSQGESISESAVECSENPSIWEIQVPLGYQELQHLGSRVDRSLEELSYVLRMAELGKCSCPKTPWSSENHE